MSQLRSLHPFPTATGVDSLQLSASQFSESNPLDVSFVSANVHARSGSADTQVRIACTLHTMAWLECSGIALSYAYPMSSCSALRRTFLR